MLVVLKGLLALFRFTALCKCFVRLWQVVPHWNPFAESGWGALLAHPHLVSSSEAAGSSDGRSWQCLL